MTHDAEQVWDAYRTLRSSVEGALSSALDAVDLSIADFEVLRGVAGSTAECVRVAALADAMGWSRSRLSRQLARMERRGLVGREPCERDGRGDDVLLTAVGEAALADARPRFHEAVDGLFGSRLTETERSGLVAAADRLR